MTRDHERRTDRDTQPVREPAPPNQGGIGSSEHGGKDSSELLEENERREGSIERERTDRESRTTRS